MSTIGTVLVTSRSFGSGDYDGRSRLESAGLSLATGAPDHGLHSLGPALAVAEAWIAGTGPVTEEHLAAAPRLRLLARYGVGTDSVDLEAARRRGVAVTNTPGANSVAVAEHALSLMLAALRRVPSGDRRVRAGQWRVDRTREVAALCVGIVGAGRIGREFAGRVRALGASVLAYDPFLAPGALRAAGLQPASLQELADRCDVVSLHAPGSGVILDRAWLASARRRPIVVNTARAVLVDEEAMAQALAEGLVEAYAADTLSTEGAGATVSPLLSAALAERTIVTPHAAAQTVGAVDAMTRGTTEAVLALAAGLPLPNVVIAPPDRTGSPA